MDVFWIALGVAILVLTFLDTFLAVLNYDEAGILVNRVVRWQWVILRSITRRVSRRWRPLVLRQVTGVLLLTTILSWIGGVVLGFTFIYLGLIGLGAFQLSQGVYPDFVGALYLSFGQFATVGADNISPAGGWVNLLPVLEALMSVVLLSFIITYLSNVYGVIQFLRSLCADFFSTGPGVGSPVDALQPYFPDGTARDLDRHLNELVDDFNLYCDSLRQDHAAYLFQSGEEQFSLPFALYMTSGVVGALRWGLPTGHDATKSPSLPRLTEVFNDFRERRYQMMKWPSPVVPDPVTAEEFRASFEGFHAQSSRSAIDPWVLRFLSLNDDMANIIGATEGVDVDDAYGRYTVWLPFAYPAQQFVTRVGHDLDYQPIYRGVAPAPDDAAPDEARETDAATGPRTAVHARRTGGVLAWARRRLLFLDPGYVRLWTALRTLGAVVLAVLAATTVAGLLDADPTTAGVFAALLAVFSVPMTSGWGAGLMRSTGLLALIPASLGIAAGAFMPRDSLATFAALAVVAAVAVWVGRFGPRWATYGQVAFIAYYFSLLLAVTQTEVVGALVAGGIGVVSSWVSNLLPLPRRSRQIRAGIRAVGERASVLIDAAIDALSAEGDRRLARALHAENRALRGSITSLTGLLDPDESELLPPDQVRTRRLQAFDVQLAADNLLRALPDASDDSVTVDERSRLAGDLLSLQPRVHALVLQDRASTHPAAVSPASSTELSNVRPAETSRAYAAIRELSVALDALLSRPDIDAAAADRADRAEDHPTESAGAPTTREATRATDRRAVQAGVATGVALYLGSFVSSTYQYWAAMPAYQALSGSNGDRLLHTVQRIVVTVLGAAAAFGLGLLTGHDAVVAFAVLCVSVFFMSFLRAVASSWTAFWQTVLLATMYDLLARLNAEAVHVRVIETIIGALVALVVAAIVLPTRTRAQVLEGMAALVTTISGVTHAALQRRADPRVATDASQARALAEQESAMQRRLDDILRHVAPLRRAPGSLQRSGIETQLTSLTALTYYARHLATDTQRTPTEPTSPGAVTANTLTPAFWQHLDAVTRDNFGSTLAVLDDRLPSRVHDPKDFTAPSGSTVSDPALADVERINQTLLAYMAALRPGSTGGAPDSG